MLACVCTVYVQRYVVHVCAWVCEREQDKEKERGESAVLCDWEKLSEIGCVCARMELILSSSQLTSFIQRMK